MPKKMQGLHATGTLLPARLVNFHAANYTTWTEYAVQLSLAAFIRGNTRTNLFYCKRKDARGKEDTVKSQT
jgi:hypothetical protein